MIGVVTDSNSQLPAEMARELGIRVVPVRIIVDGDDMAEHVDVSTEQFYGLLAAGARAVSTAQPRPSDLVAAYRDALASGCRVVISVHVGAEYSGTVDAAHLAARQVPELDVRVIDSEATSFGVGCCARRAAEMAAAGAGADEVVADVLALRREIRNVFVLDSRELATASGRLQPLPPESGKVQVFELVGDELVVRDECRTMECVATSMVSTVRAAGPVRVAVAVGDASTQALASMMVASLSPAPEVIDVVQYRVGPSVAAVAGAASVGAYFSPR